MINEDIFIKKALSPMLLNETTPFNSPDYIYELKLDGIRCLVYVDPNSGTELRNKRNKDVTQIYPELMLLHKQVAEKCVLDGELIAVGADGKPDFFKLQHRSILCNPLKISIEAERSPVQFVAYDILYLGGKSLIHLPLMQRKELLSINVKESKRLSISRYIEEKGIEFFELAKQNELEGIVAKRKDSYYYFGKRSKDWLKIKVMQEEDLVIVGYLPSDDGKIKDIALGYYDSMGELRERGRVYFGVSRADNDKLLRFAINNKQEKPLNFKEDNRVIWLKPQLVGTVKYMMETKGGGMRQPVFKGIRDDKIAMDCIDIKWK